MPRLHRRKFDQILEQAELLVNAASVFAVGLYTEMAKHIPVVYDIDTEQWDFIVTVGGVFVAATRLNNLKNPEEREEQLMEIVARRLSEWNPDGIAGFEDCKDFFDRTYNGLASLKEYKQEPQFLASDAVGAWMVWNLLGHSPETDEERELVRTLGASVVHTFFDWWQTAK